MAVTRELEIKYGSYTVPNLDGKVQLTRSKDEGSLTFQFIVESSTEAGFATAVKAAEAAFKAPPKPRASTVIQHGIRQPGKGGKCRAVWDAMDDLVKNRKVGKNDLYGAKDIAVADARILAGKNDWNVNNTVIEFYQWRKFNGV